MVVASHRGSANISSEASSPRVPQQMRPVEGAAEKKSAAPLTPEPCSSTVKLQEARKIAAFISQSGDHRLYFLLALPLDVRMRSIVSAGSMEWYGRPPQPPRAAGTAPPSSRTAAATPRSDGRELERISRLRSENGAAAGSTNVANPSPSSGGGCCPLSGAPLPEDSPHYTNFAASTTAIDNAMLDRQLRDADADKDDVIGKEDFLKWVRRAAESRREVSWFDLWRIFIFAGVPFTAFGFLDNSLMLLAGDRVDATIGAAYGLSVMGAAACGAVFSGAIGMQFHGITERFVVTRLGLTPPALTPAQMKHPSLYWASHFGGTIGLAVGLLLGMFPLLFLDTGSTTHRAQDQAIKHWEEDVAATDPLRPIPPTSSTMRQVKESHSER